VLKLISKTAEERYQSSSGLKADLERCLKTLEATCRIEAFEIGGQDISGKFDPLHRHIPCNATIDAFLELVRESITESRERREHWKEKRLAALGPNGLILIDVIRITQHLPKRGDGKPKYPMSMLSESLKKRDKKGQYYPVT
jgi:predicted ATPase